MSDVTSTPQQQVRDIARAVYNPYFDSLSDDELRSLKIDMEELQKHPGWARLQDVIGGDFTAFAEVAVLTGNFDPRNAGIAAGTKRVLDFPEYVTDAYAQRVATDGEPRESTGA